MAIDFPSSPSLNQIFTTANNTYIWNGVSWVGYTTSIVSYATTAQTAIALQNTRTFSIAGDVVALPVNFNGTGNVALTAAFASNANLPGNVTIANDLQVNNDLNVAGNITIGGTAAYIIVNDFRVKDKDIVLGFATDSYGNDVSNDTTANHGGIAVASTEGTPLVSIYNPGVGETTPATYKKIMWFKSGSFAGLNTDAWLINYAVGIGSTQFPSGTRLAAGSVQFTERDLSVVRNINASGIVTATAFYGDGSKLSNIITGVTVRKDTVLVGTGASVLDFTGIGVSTVTVSSGIATVNIPGTVRNTSYTVAYAGQTIFPCTYTIGYVDVFFNGSKLSPTQYTAPDGANIILAEAASANDIVETVGYNGVLKLSASKTILTDVSSDGLISYTGKADVGVTTTQASWTIRKSLFSSVGIVTSVGIARNVAWSNRASVVYT